MVIIYLLMIILAIASIIWLLKKTYHVIKGINSSDYDNSAVGVYSPVKSISMILALLIPAIVFTGLFQIFIKQPIVETEYDIDEETSTVSVQNIEDESVIAHDNKSISNNSGSASRPIVVLRDSVDVLLKQMSMSSFIQEGYAETTSSGIKEIKDINGKTYRLDELKEELLLIPYNSEGYEIFFLGYINMNGHWDGKCLINSYKDNKLIFANDVIYDDGFAKSFIQYYESDGEVSYIKKEAVPAYQIYRKDTDDAGNKYVYIGETVAYKKVVDIEQQVDFNAPNKDKLFYPEDVISKNKGKIYKYYDGISSRYTKKNGKKSVGANDFKGMSKYIEYYDDGCVRMLYYGKFKNGVPEDDEGESWEIVCNRDKGVNYVYNYGLFSDGKYDYSDNQKKGLSSHNISNLTMDEIEEIINNSEFSDMKLDWAPDCIGN